MNNVVGYHIEHIIALIHGGQTVEANLAFSCSRCNQYKGTNIADADPETGEPTFLFTLGVIFGTSILNGLMTVLFLG